MSVIVSRALPDVRDGLKPSQRRILVVLNDLGLSPTSHYRKSAKIAGDTTGNYHPHGESIVYPTMVKLAQDFSMRYQLVDGQGNFGSIDGDPPAQMRYTEARMKKLTQEMLKNLDKGTVLYTPNYDGMTLEPTVLPSAFPNILCNGADGIAVGMATKIPPHNLGEIIDALQSMIRRKNKWEGTAIYNKLRLDREKKEKIPQVLESRAENYLESYTHKDDPKLEEKLAEIKEKLSVSNKINEEKDPKTEGPITLYPQFESNITVDDLVEYIPGPDFPTGALAYDQSEIKNAYATGRGRILIRAKAMIEESKGGKFRIIITEIPYQVNKAHMIEKMAGLVKNKRVEGISDIRDESNREGIRVVIDLKKTAQPKTVLNKLYKYTELQKSFSANMIALVDGQPQTLTLKRILELFLTHRLEVTIRKYEFQISQSKYRLHILEGLRKALDHLDEVISTIRKSKTQDEAKENLIEKFKFSDVQAQAILDMQLRRLAALERKKIADEYKETKAKIKGMEEILADPSKVLTVIKDELTEMKKKHSDPRRTKMYKGKVDEIAEEDMVAKEETFVTLSKAGYIKRTPPSTYQIQKRGGKGITGAKTKEGDYIEQAITCNTHDDIIFFTNRGRAFDIKAFEVPEFGRNAKGIPVVNLINLDQDELITTLLMKGEHGFGTSENDIDIKEDIDKKPAKGDTSKTSAQGSASGRKKKPKNSKYLFMATKNGTVKKTAISEFENIRSNGLISIKLEKDDELGWVVPTTGRDEIILVSKYGRSIRFKEKDVRHTGRNTMGVRGIAFKEEDDEVVSMQFVEDNKDLLLVISENGMGKMTKLSGYPTQGRAGQGVFTFRVKPKTGNVVVSKIIKNKDDTEIVLISKKGIVIRVGTKGIAQLGRQTSGVKIMKLNKGDAVAAIAVL
jgi:DNA gyrase subunit A